MIFNTKNAQEVAEKLIEIQAIKLQPNEPFTWSSGWKSPIYCDNRITLSSPKVRNFLKDLFVKVIQEKYGMPDVIAGVATGAIGIGALVADALDLPFVYVRSEPKKHGAKKQVEGKLLPNSKVIVIEDLVSTGKSSLNAVRALRAEGVSITSMIAIFTYGFEVANKCFEKENVELCTLSDYNSLLENALAFGLIKQEDLELLNSWRANPEAWTGVLA